MDKSELKKELEETVRWFEKILSKIQTWKASTWVIEDLDVYIPSWGQTQKLIWLWQVSLLDASTIKIETWDKSVLPHIEKAIYESNLWFTPVNQWDRIMIKIPPMTEERRREIIKVVKKELEEAKKRIRIIRHDYLKKIKRLFEEKVISEDEKKKQEKEVEEIIKNYNKKLEEMAKAKENQIMKI